MAVRLDRISDAAAPFHDLVVGLLLLGCQRPVLRFRLLGDLTGLGQLRPDLGHLLLIKKLALNTKEIDPGGT